jgi:hypothetical protein
LRPPPPLAASLASPLSAGRLPCPCPSSCLPCPLPCPSLLGSVAHGTHDRASLACAHASPPALGAGSLQVTHPGGDLEVGDPGGRSVGRHGRILDVAPPAVKTPRLVAGAGGARQAVHVAGNCRKTVARNRLETGLALRCNGMR